MALWARVQSLSGNSYQNMYSIYGNDFPIEVRHVLAEFIEDKFLGFSDLDSDPNNFSYQSYIVNSIAKLINLLEDIIRSKTELNYCFRMKLSRAAVNFRQRYSNDPMGLYTSIRRCLDNEQHLVEQMISPHLTQSVSLDEDSQIEMKLAHTKQQTEKTAEILKEFKLKKKIFIDKCYEQQNIEVNLSNCRQSHQVLTAETQAFERILIAKKESLQNELHHRLNGLVLLVNGLYENIRSITADLKDVKQKVLDEKLKEWKQAQKLVGQDSIADLNQNLSKLQSWCENLAEVVWDNHQQLKQVELEVENIPQFFQNETNFGNKLAQLVKQAILLLQQVLFSSFVIERQPSQVLKIGARFVSNPVVRLLVGNKLGIYMNSPKVTVNIISEAQARVLVDRNRMIDFSGSSGHIVNNQTAMRYNEETHQLSATFRNMKLDSIQRANKEELGSDSVLDEKFCLHFKCKFTVGESELHINAWVISLPIIVIVHANQETKAYARIMWDNAFSESEREPFQVPGTVPWYQFAQALSDKYKTMNGRGLTDENLQYLGEKIFFSPNFQSGDHVTWSKFYKELLPNCDFTFWEWFYATLKLTQEHFRDLWKKGYIAGLVKHQDNGFWFNCPGGTFLIRFSDSVLGAVTITWVQPYENNLLKVLSVNPFTSKDLSIRKLDEQIMDIPYLTILHPNIPKANAFENSNNNSAGSETPVQPTTNLAPYVSRRIEAKIEIPRLDAIATPSVATNSVDVFQSSQQQQKPSISQVYTPNPAFNLNGICLPDSVKLVANEFQQIQSANTGPQVDFSSILNESSEDNDISTSAAGSFSPDLSSGLVELNMDEQDDIFFNMV